MIDTTQMKTVIRNFISNALKFSSHGQQIIIELSIQNNFTKDKLLLNDNSLNQKIFRLNVIDNGPGVSKVNFFLIYFII